MSIAEGQTLGNYQILSRLGEGGMGAVYLAEHPLIGKKVALKVIHGELASNREVVQRFFNEAKAVNKIGNEHIVEIHDFGQTPAGEHFYIMEYLDGLTLAQVLERETVFEVGRALHVSVQIASALAAAHAAGIIHRDLKPDNIMLIERLGDANYVKVLDFGLAKVFVDAGGAKLTAQGVVLGTPQYMSPEACESKQDIDHRSDIYSLGILMFQMMTGSLPFDGNSMGEVMVKHVTQPPPALRAINPNIPPAVEQIILRCLAKRTDSRFGTMLNLREALLDPDRYLASSPPIMPSAPQADPNARTMFLDAASRRPSEEQAAVAKPPARDFALRPPPPSMIGDGLVGGLGAQAGGLPSSPRRDGATGPAAVIASGGPVTPGAVLTASASAKTAFMDVGAVTHRASGEAGAPPSISAARPVAAANHTMVIGTPRGHKDAPPSPKWPLYVAMLAVLAVGGGIAAFVILGSGPPATAAGAGAAAESPAAAQTSMPADAAVTMDAPPATAKIKLRTTPSDAEVLDEEGRSLGKTPLDLELLVDGRERTLVFRHPKAQERSKTMVFEGDGEFAIELEPLEEGAPSPTPTKPEGERTDGPGAAVGKALLEGSSDPPRTTSGGKSSGGKSSGGKSSSGKSSGGKSSSGKSSGGKSSGGKSTGNKAGDGTMLPDF